MSHLIVLGPLCCLFVSPHAKCFQWVKTDWFNTWSLRQQSQSDYSRVFFLTSVHLKGVWPQKSWWSLQITPIYVQTVTHFLHGSLLNYIWGWFVELIGTKVLLQSTLKGYSSLSLLMICWKPKIDISLTINRYSQLFFSWGSEKKWRNISKQAGLNWKTKDNWYQIHKCKMPVWKP